MQKQIKILFFIKEAVPTPADRLAAYKISGAKVCFRNVTYIEGVDEACDGVAGAVPDCYKGFPTAAQAMAKQEAALMALQKQFGEVAAPKKTQQPPKPPQAPAANPPAPTANVPAWNPNLNPPA